MSDFVVYSVTGEQPDDPENHLNVNALPGGTVLVCSGDGERDGEIVRIVAGCIAQYERLRQERPMNTPGRSAHGAEARKVLAERPAEVRREQFYNRLVAVLPLGATDLALDELWPLIESQQALIASGHAALEAVLAYNAALAATCTCSGTYATYEGPEPECPVHGAVRAFNEAQAAISRTLARVLELEAWAYRDLSGDAQRHVLAVVTNVRDGLDPDRTGDLAGGGSS